MSYEAGDESFESGMISALLEGVYFTGNLLKGFGNLGGNRKLLTCNYTIKVI